jgi:hypothetical protein
MRIDLTSVGNGHTLSNYEMMVLKGSYIHRGVINANADTNGDFNYLIISMNVFNAIDSHPMFVPWSDAKYIDGPYYVGRLGTFECYVDLYLPPNTILMQYNKQVARDKRIDNILNDVDILTEVEIIIDGL